MRLSWTKNKLLLSALTFIAGFLYPIAGILIYAIGNRKHWNTKIGGASLLGCGIALFLYVAEYFWLLL